jgi:DNA polymerase-3 subunit beta
MKFTIGKAGLQQELNLVQSVVERKNTIPVLTNLLIESIGADSIRISATDLDVTIRVDTAVETISAEGAICVPAKKLFDIVRLLPDGPIVFTRQDNDWVTVEADKSTFNLPGISKDTFPDLPACKAMPQSVSAGLLSSLINQTIYAITEEEGRYTLSGAKFEIGKKRTRVITTDGHRLALAETNGAFHLQDVDDIEALIPRKTLTEIAKIASTFDGDVNFAIDENHVYFQIGTRTIISRLLAGQFPNYEMVLPKDNDNVATFNRGELSKALKRMSLMADGKSHAIKLDIGKDETVITGQSQDEGEGREVISSHLSGEPVVIGFNAQYIQDFLAVTASERVSFHYKNDSTQTEFRPVTEDDARRLIGILMPMRL